MLIINNYIGYIIGLYIFRDRTQYKGAAHNTKGRHRGRPLQIVMVLLINLLGFDLKK